MLLNDSPIPTMPVTLPVVSLPLLVATLEKSFVAVSKSPLRIPFVTDTSFAFNVITWCATESVNISLKYTSLLNEKADRLSKNTAPSLLKLSLVPM